MYPYYVTIVTVENENKNNIQPESTPLTVEEEAAALRSSIDADKSDLALMKEGGELSDEEAAEFEREIDEKEMLLHFFHETLSRLNPDSSDTSFPARQEAADEDRQSVAVDFGEIGWIPSGEKISKPLEKVGREDIPVYFGSIVEDDRVTKNAADRLIAEGEWDGLMEKLKTDVLPQLWTGIITGRGKIRPISRGNRPGRDVKAENSLDTSYPAYKVGVHGTNNRAIVLVVDKIDEVPVFMLAAMYDHDDQQRVMQHTFLKTRKGTS